jgi:hypothetical protein
MTLVLVLAVQASACEVRGRLRGTAGGGGGALGGDRAHPLRLRQTQPRTGICTGGAPLNLVLNLAPDKL